MVLSCQLLEHLTSAKEGTEMLYMPTLTTPKPTLDISNKSQHSYLIHPETTPGSCSAKSSRQQIQIIGVGIILGCTLWLPLPHHLFPHKGHRVWLQSSTFHWNCSIKNLYQLPSHQIQKSFWFDTTLTPHWKPLFPALWTQCTALSFIQHLQVMSTLPSHCFRSFLHCQHPSPGLTDGTSKSEKLAIHPHTPKGSYPPITVSSSVQVGSV